MRPPHSPSALVLRTATVADTAVIVTFIHELAGFEKLAHECFATEESVRHWLFGKTPRAQCLIAEWDGKPAAFALYFYNFSTFLSKPGIYLEDLFVRPEFRRRGIARTMFQALARQALNEGCGRLEWWVLNWNEDAIRFYASMGAVAMKEWTVQRISGDALTALAA